MSPPFFMTIIKTGDRLEVIEALMNECLKDRTSYCNTCDTDYNPATYPCCESPMLGTNADFLKAIIIENQITKQSLIKPTGASKKNTMRFAFNIPYRMYHFIKNYFAGYGENFPKDNKELRRLMRRFKKLTIAETI